MTHFSLRELGSSSASSNTTIFPWRPSRTSFPQSRQLTNFQTHVNLGVYVNNMCLLYKPKVNSSCKPIICPWSWRYANLAAIQNLWTNKWFDVLTSKLTQCIAMNQQQLRVVWRTVSPRCWWPARGKPSMHPPGRGTTTSSPKCHHPNNNNINNNASIDNTDPCINTNNHHHQDRYHDHHHRRQQEHYPLTNDNSSQAISFCLFLGVHIQIPPWSEVLKSKRWQTIKGRHTTCNPPCTHTYTEKATKKNLPRARPLRHLVQEDLP